MTKYELVGFRANDFKDNNGNSHSGYRLYFTYSLDQGEGLGTSNIWIQSDKFNQIKPSLNHFYQIYYNRFGKVDTISSCE